MLVIGKLKKSLFAITITYVKASGYWNTHKNGRKLLNLFFHEQLKCKSERVLTEITYLGKDSISSGSVFASIRQRAGEHNVACF